MIYGDTNVVRSSQAEEILKIYWKVIVQLNTMGLKPQVCSPRDGEKTASTGQLFFPHKNPTFMVENDDRNAR